MKQQQEEVNKKPKQEKPTKQKAKIRKKGLTKQEQKTFKTCRKIVFFKHHQLTFQTKPFFGHKKHQCAQLVFFFLVL